MTGVSIAAAIGLEGLARPPSLEKSILEYQDQQMGEDSQGVIATGKRSHAYPVHCGKGIQLSKHATAVVLGVTSPVLVRIKPILERNGI